MTSSYSFDLQAAQSIPENIRFGTSTWTYPGWKGLIYNQQYKSDKAFRAESLAEYSQFGLFRTVGIDSTFYGPPSVELLQRYADQVPDSFCWVSKVWERLTIPKYPSHPRYGDLKGQVNPDFLNPQLFIDAVLPPYSQPEVIKHTGPFVFQFPTINKSLMPSQEFFPKLEQFLHELPDEFRYAIEIRNPEYLCEEYFSILNRAHATHCFNHWNYMPSLRKQMEAAAHAGGLKADFFCSRILTPKGMNYQEAVKTFQPYSEIRRENTEMRQDVVTLVRRALKRNNKAFIIVNNRAEGCSPITIDQLGRILVDEIS